MILVLLKWVKAPLQLSHLKIKANNNLIKFLKQKLLFVVMELKYASKGCWTRLALRFHYSHNCVCIFIVILFCFDQIKLVNKLMSTNFFEVTEHFLQQIIGLHTWTWEYQLLIEKEKVIFSWKRLYCRNTQNNIIDYNIDPKVTLLKDLVG